MLTLLGIISFISTCIFLSIVCFFYFFFFFFSSRRRHTRSLCDWSSDVCSSDLNPTVLAFGHGSVLVLAGQSAVAEGFPGGPGLPLPTVEEFASGTWHLRAPEPEALSDSGIVILPKIGRASCRERV